MWRILIKLVRIPAVQNAALFIAMWAVERISKDERKRS